MSLTTPNIFENIFRGLYVNHTVNIKKVVITINPFRKDRDDLSTIGEAGKYSIFANSSGNGVLTLSYKGGESGLPASSWSPILDMPAYRLSVDHLRPNRCYDYINGKYPRDFSIQAFDIYGRGSNILVRSLKVRTALIVISNANPMVITNDDPYTSVFFNENVTRGDAFEERVKLLFSEY